MAEKKSKIDEDFDKFWQAYPKKVGKKTAKKSFEKAVSDDGVALEVLLNAIKRQKCGNQWTKENGRFIPNPATWLNQGRWEDEVINDGYLPDYIDPSERVGIYL